MLRFFYYTYVCIFIVIYLFKAEVGRLKNRANKKHGARIFEFSYDVLTYGVGVNIYDKTGCIVRNYDEIISYSPALIIINTNIGRLMLKGRDMELIETDSFELKIKGTVKSAEFSGE